MSVVGRINTGHFVDKVSFLLCCFELLQQEFFATPALDAVCLQPPFLGGKQRKCMTCSRFERSSWELLGGFGSANLMC